MRRRVRLAQSGRAGEQLERSQSCRVVEDLRCDDELVGVALPCERMKLFDDAPGSADRGCGEHPFEQDALGVGGILSESARVRTQF